jgi:hypothetical protein
MAHSGHLDSHPTPRLTTLPPRPLCTDSNLPTLLCIDPCSHTLASYQPRVPGPPSPLLIASIASTSFTGPHVRQLGHCSDRVQHRTRQPVQRQRQLASTCRWPQRRRRTCRAHKPHITHQRCTRRFDIPTSLHTGAPPHQTHNTYDSRLQALRDAGTGPVSALPPSCSDLIGRAITST